MKRIIEVILKHKIISIIITALVLLVGIALIYFLTGNYQAGSYETPGGSEFSMDGFVDAMELSNNNKLVASNGSYELYLDETTSYFYCLDKKTGEKIASNTTERDAAIGPNQVSQQEKQFATLEITYFDRKGAITTINNYAMSIFHPESLSSQEGLRTYQIKYIEKGFQVLYNISNLEIDYLYFPKFISGEFYDSMTTQQQSAIRASYQYRTTEDGGFYYECNIYERMTLPTKRRLYPIFYGENGLGYTRERAISENAEWGYESYFEQVSFQIGMEITLNEKGFMAKVLRESLLEESNAKIARITLLPMLGLGYSDVNSGVDNSGYLVVPDGSGALINFNNGRGMYQKRLYGSDLGLMPIRMPETQQKISIPLFGMKKANIGFAGIIVTGDAMSSINAEVSAKTGSYSSSYNKVYASFSLREMEAVRLGSGWNQYGIQLWTDKIIDTDFSVQYNILTGADNNYMGMAKQYQQYLVDNYGLTKSKEANKTLVTTEFIGAYDAKKHFVGIPYTANNSLTTYEQAITIFEELSSRGITNIMANYLGAINGGLTSSLANKTNIERVIGGNSGYQKYKQYTDSHNIDEYTTVNFLTTSKYDKLFDEYRYNARRLQKSLSYLYQYHLPTSLPYSETTFIGPDDLYVINPRYYQEIYTDFAKKSKLNGLAFSDLGGQLAGAYGDADIIYLQYALDMQEDILKQIDKQIMFSNPLGFAIPYASSVIDLPTEATLYAIVDYSIPLLQLVLAGYLEYTGESINTSVERNADYLFLKAIETGSNLKYTLSYDSSQELLNTFHNEYVSTDYINWLDDIERRTKELDTLKIHEGYLVSHEMVSMNVFKVTYSNGVEIVLNYNLSNINYNGQTVNSMDYYLVKAGDDL